MDISAMNVRVMFQKNETTKDKYGNHKEVWKDYFSCFATISGENGKEQAVVGTTVEAVELQVTVRYSKETKVIQSTNYRITIDGELYDILSVDHLSYKRRALKFKCRKTRR